MIHWIKVEIVFWKERKRKGLKILHLLVLKYEKWNLFSTVFQYEVWKYSLRCSGSTLVRFKAAKCSSWHAMQTSWCKLQTDWKGLKGSQPSPNIFRNIFRCPEKTSERLEDATALRHLSPNLLGTTKFFLSGCLECTLSFLCWRCHWRHPCWPPERSLPPALSSNTHAVVECRIRIDQEAPLIVFLFVNKQWCTALCLLMGQDLALSRPLGARLRRYSCLLCLPLIPTHGVLAWGGEVQIFSMWSLHWRRGQHWSVYIGAGEDVWVYIL